ncbi:hypothetical protein GCM10025864_36080 [Luteimicrobium album]|uniref:RHS repeat-associated core domain-containing protein n=1 Tax=Luteimicrobium album TaxID=1054550 RepID=A0ABQ6I7V5_9MICO|nr:RHS repeat-associated core domain-containing protein [Luteimicrobium album]GMA25849.1 hypothetical protein GCM10025864_36080 [Luteimicrobium album]
MKDPKGNTWSYSYDFAGQQIKADDPDAGVAATTYDAAGQVTSTTDATGKKLTYAYDGIGRPTTASEGSTVRSKWTYDTAKDTAGKVLLGQVASSTRYVDSAAYTTSVPTYDDAYRPLATTVTLPATGDLAKLTARSFTTKYTYTADGQVASTTLPKITTGGSSGGSAVLGQEKVTTYYDTASQARWMGGGFGWGTYVAESRFSAYGQPLAIDLGNTYGAVASYRYDEVTRRLTSVALKREQITGTDLAVSYKYDAAGNVTSVTDQPTNGALGGTAGQDNQCFRYDGLQRLTTAWTAKTAGDCSLAPSQVTAAKVGGAAPYWTEYSYDPLGNRTVKTDHATDGSTGTTMTRSTYGQSAGPHALTSTTVSTNGGTAVAGAMFGYDGAGQQTSRHVPGASAFTMSWDAGGSLTQIAATGAGEESDPGLDEGEASFVYDADGNRVSRTDAGGTTVYLPGGQEFHVDSDGGVSATRYYSFAGQTVAVRTDRGLGGVTSLVTDPHGTTLAAVPNTTWTTTSVERFFTDPFGAVRGPSTIETVPGDRQFLGKTRDESTGLTLLGARYYDETTGTFISVDPLLSPTDPQHWNGYAYARNNPLTYSDPDGRIPVPYAYGDALIPGRPVPTASANQHTASKTHQSDTPTSTARRANASVGTSTVTNSYLGGAGNKPASAAPVQVSYPASAAGAYDPNREFHDRPQNVFEWAIWYAFGFDDMEKCDAGSNFSCVMAMASVVTVPIGGLEGIGAKAVEKVGAKTAAKVVEKAAAKKATSTVLANKAAGDAARDSIAAVHPGSAIEQSFQTEFGVRRIDVFTGSGTGIESKVGRTSLSASTRSQIAKDSWLMENNPEVGGIEWVFTRSGVTGRLGPTKPLQNALTEARIPWTVIP